MQLWQVADLRLHHPLQAGQLRWPQSVVLETFGQIEQIAVHLHESIVGMLRQRAGEVGGFMLGAAQIALVCVPDLPAVKEDQRGGNDDDKHAGLK